MRKLIYAFCVFTSFMGGVSAGTAGSIGSVVEYWITRPES